MIKQYEMEVDEDYKDEDNIIATSLVENPATHKYFAVFSDETPKNEDLKFTVLPTKPNNQMVNPNDEGKFERIISGVWFMPDTDYPRMIKNEDGTEELITTRMSADELMKAVANFAKSGKINDFNIMHDGELIEGLRTMEVWMLVNHFQPSPILLNTIDELGYREEDIPLGTVFMTVYIENEQFFNDYILTGKVKGFSIEGFFKLYEKEQITEQTMEDNRDMLQVFNALGLHQSEGTLLTDKGKLTISKEDIKLNEETAENGTYKLGTGFTLEIRQGKVVDFGFEVQGTVESAPVTTTETTETTTNVEQVDTPTEPTVEETVNTEEVTNVEEATVENNTTDTEVNKTEVDTVVKVDNTLADQLKTLQEQLAAIEAERATEKEALEAAQAELKQLKEKELKSSSIPVKTKQTTSTVKTITKTVGGKSFEVPVV